MQQKRTIREYQTEYDHHKIILRKRPTPRRRTRALLQDMMYPVTLAFALSICFSGVGALGCWGFEIIAANASPMTSSSYHWRSRKNICLGAMLVGLSGCLGSALVGGILGGVDE
ncbi:hypothetical protein [Anabaena azotica]|uniref:Uncharacterized protein n=1 Tax=Anabaena azotica FACHB-119 TaxID=947527 RepID=A0ABR8DC60_9NOST|nr:hypothetical protein [Anabaena azotica]MBD2504699.1 hypothetical protein [Anabaena azotica FACHB-119]